MDRWRTFLLECCFYEKEGNGSYRFLILTPEILLPVDQPTVCGKKAPVRGLKHKIEEPLAVLVWTTVVISFFISPKLLMADSCNTSDPNRSTQLIRFTTPNTVLPNYSVYAYPYELVCSPDLIQRSCACHAAYGRHPVNVTNQVPSEVAYLFGCFTTPPQHVQTRVKGRNEIHVRIVWFYGAVSAAEAT
jgi:hypothetical protein